MISCLRLNPKERPTLADIVGLPLIKHNDRLGQFEKQEIKER